MAKLSLDGFLRDIRSSGKATFLAISDLDDFERRRYQPNADRMVKAFGKARCCQNLMKSPRVGFDVWLDGEDLAEVQGPERYLEVLKGAIIAAMAPTKLSSVGDSDNLPRASFYFKYPLRAGKADSIEVYLHMAYSPPLTDAEAEEWRKAHPYPRGI